MSNGELPAPQPLDQEWERAAVKELIDILNWLGHGSFVSPDDLCERLQQSERAIRMVWGRGETASERMAEWRERLARFEADQKRSADDDL